MHTVAKRQSIGIGMRTLKFLMASRGWGYSLSYIGCLITCLPIVSSAASPQATHHKSTFTFPNALPGQAIEVDKVYDPVARTIRLTSNSSYIQSGDDLVKLERQEEALLYKKHGALAHSRLLADLDTLQPGGKLDVLVSIREPDGVVYLDKTKHSAEETRQQSLSLLTLQPVVSIPTLLARHGLKSKANLSSRRFRAEVTRTELEKLAFDADVSSLEEVPPPGKPLAYGNPDLTSLSRSAYWHANVIIPSDAGYGVRAATFEDGLDPAIVACWGGLNPAQLEAGGTDHGHQTFRLLMATAPAANLWHFNSRSYWARQNDIIADQIQTMSMSIESYSSETTDDMRFMDDMAYRWPYPVFCNPTANGGYNLQSEWLCYNAINVGNVRHTNQTHWELDGCTQTTNPPHVYSVGNWLANDRELPMLVAPGISSDINNLYEKESCTGSTGWCGTSWSAPIVNGLAADVIAADSRMSGWPEKVRAALLLTAQNVDGGYWDDTQDGRDGAGVVNGANAVAFAKGHTSVGRYGTPAVDGLDANALAASDFTDPNPIIYKIQIRNPKPSGMHLRVVLTWDSNPTPVGSATSENPLSDLDLTVSNSTGSQSEICVSRNSNVEMVDIDNLLFSPGETVDARIYKVINRIPATSRAPYFYYAIGWTWVQDHAL